MKTSGGLNFFHYLGWLAKHVNDGEVQAVYKTGLSARKLGRKLMAVYRRSLKKAQKDKLKSGDEVDVPIAPSDAKFPIGRGIAFARFDPIGPSIGGGSLPAIWKRFGEGETDQAKEWYNELGRWHAGYPSGTRGKMGSMKPEFFPDGSGGHQDMRFYQGSLTLPAWDSSSLSVSCKVGEVCAAEFDDFLERVLKRLTKGEFERRVSCGATRLLKMMGLGVHPQDGTLHLHPLFIRVELLGFLKNDGRLLPENLAPKGGRRRKGEGWVGGERLGLVGDTGKQVTNPLGPAGCATSALREIEMPPSLEHGPNWNLHDHILEARSGMKQTGNDAGKASSMKGQAGRAREDALGESYDDFGSRIFRDEILRLAERNVKFATRRKKAIEEAIAAQNAANDVLIELIAGKKIAELEGIIAAQKATITALQAGKPKAPAAGASAAKDSPAAAPSTATETPKDPLFPAEDITKALQEANDLVKAGKDLSSLTPRQLEIVEIKPAERVKKVKTAEGLKAELDGAGKEVMEPNPFAGKVGLTGPAYQSVTGVIFTSTKALENRDISKLDHDKHMARLSAYGEAKAAARSSMGLPAKEESAQEVMDHEPQFLAVA